MQNQNPEQIARDKIDAMLIASGWAGWYNPKIKSGLKEKKLYEFFTPCIIYSGMKAIIKK